MRYSFIIAAFMACNIGYSQQNEKTNLRSINSSYSLETFSILEKDGKCSQDDLNGAQKLLSWAMRNSTAVSPIELEYYRLMVNETKVCSGAINHQEYCTTQKAQLKVLETLYLRGASDPNLPEIYRLLPAVHIRNRMVLSTRCAD